MIRKVLVANRGEIALRVARACRELGIGVVAVYSTPDRKSPVVAMADEAVHIGPSAPRHSYLNIPNIVEAARNTGCDAVHPGYGFLSEDPDFADICAVAGLTFIGPPPQVMQRVGNKATARRLMSEAGLPLLPGVVEPVRTPAEGRAIAADLGYPVIIKAAAGGGGRGMAVVTRGADFEEAFTTTRNTARAVFGDPAVYVERFLVGARHIEVQILCDSHGAGVHLGERDCSIQRRHQKLLEEGPSRYLDAEQRERLGALAVQGALAVGYTGAGTMEFLVDAGGSAYFMEMNARIQVEHPVTEMLTGVDLVREQLLIAGGAHLSVRQRDIRISGAAIECRVNAEDPTRGFAPAPGLLTEYVVPDGPWTRVETAYRQGDRVSPFYDSLVAKVIVWAPDRGQAIARMHRALGEFRVSGPGTATTIGLHRALLADETFVRDRHDVQFLDRYLPDLLRAAADEPVTAPRTTSEPATAPESPAGRRPTRRVPKETFHMSSANFTQQDLMDLLTTTGGLSPAAYTADPSATFDSIGLDSLAYLSLQTEIANRYGLELPDSPYGITLGTIVDHVGAALEAADTAKVA